MELDIKSEIIDILFLDTTWVTSKRKNLLTLIDYLVVLVL